MPRIAPPGAVEAACWLLAAALACATAWPGALGLEAAGFGQGVPSRSEAERDAAAVLRRVAGAERRLAEAQQGYRPIGPQGAAASLDLPGYEAPPGASRFLVDALPGEDGSLLLRAVTRPDAVRDGSAAPVVLRQELPPLAPASAPGAAARLSASTAP